MGDECNFFFLPNGQKKMQSYGRAKILKTDQTSVKISPEMIHPKHV